MAVGREERDGASALQRTNTVFETSIPRKGIARLQSQFPHSFVCERFIYSHDRSPILLQEICGLILGIYKSLTDTWMWKLGLRQRNSQKRNTWMGFLLHCTTVWQPIYFDWLFSARVGKRRESMGQRLPSAIPTCQRWREVSTNINKKYERKGNPICASLDSFAALSLLFKFLPPISIPICTY
jgi:hypothetical protein